MPAQDSGCPVMRFIGCSILAVIVGVPGLLFLIVLTFGAISAPFVGLLLLAPFILANTVLWAPWLLIRRLSDKRPNGNSPA